MSERVPSSASTGSASRVRRYDSPSPTRSRKRRYSVKQPSAMCCPLSGGGSGSSSRSGQRLHSAAERRARLVDGDVDARIDEVERSCEAREPAAHDGDLHRSRPRATTASFAGVESRHDASKTSKPFASMRSSWPL